MAGPGLFKDMKKTFLFHAIAAHFSNGLIPIAVLYLLLTLSTGDTYFEHTVEHLILIVILAIPFSFFSGVYDWKTKYRGAKAPIFIKKIRLSVLLFIFCFSAVGIRLTIPDVMNRQGPEHWLYLALLFSMLPVVTLLGHYGGKLSSLPKPSAPKPAPPKP
jgi:heme/copper-type cytochrome/quinol oxidase subunit 1